jgi:hypothetical protein
MTCRITVSLLSEFVDGNIGDEWQYSLAVDVVDPAQGGGGRIDVPRHKLKAGATRELVDGPSTEFDAGSCGDTIRLELTLAAAEVDWVFSDTGEDSATVEMRCPAPGGAPVIVEREVSTYVEERPRLLGGSANFVVKLRIAGRCE